VPPPPCHSAKLAGALRMNHGEGRGSRTFVSANGDSAEETK
jgi:hypothetical protein